MHAVEGLHQRRLAGAVLADDGVNGARPDVEVHVVVGDDTWEPLFDSCELHRQRVAAHCPPFAPSRSPVIAESPGANPRALYVIGLDGMTGETYSLGTSMSPAMIAALISSS